MTENSKVDYLRNLQQIKTNHIMALRPNSCTISINKHYNDRTWRFTSLTLNLSSELYELLVKNLAQWSNGVPLLFFLDESKVVDVCPLAEWTRLNSGD